MKSEAARATSPTSLSEATPGILDRCARPPSPAQALPASHPLLACLIQDDFKLQKRPFLGLISYFPSAELSSSISSVGGLQPGQALGNLPAHAGLWELIAFQSR